MKKSKSKSKTNGESEQAKVKARAEDIANKIMSEKDEADDTIWWWHDEKSIFIGIFTIKCRNLYVEFAFVKQYKINTFSYSVSNNKH